MNSEPLDLSGPSNATAADQLILGDLPLGGRLLVRSRKDWRFAAVVRTIDALVVLSVASPGGRTYKLHREADTPVVREGNIQFICTGPAECWRDNLSGYDRRW